MIKIKEFTNGTLFQLRNKSVYFKLDNLLVNIKNGEGLNVEIYDDELYCLNNKQLDVLAYATSNTSTNNEILHYFKHDIDWSWMRNEMMLKDQEREYLANLFYPFKDSVIKIFKKTSILKKSEYLSIQIDDNIINLPDFEKGKHYTNLIADRKEPYTVVELGINFGSFINELKTRLR